MKPIKCNTKYDKTIWAGERIIQIRDLKERYGTTWDVSFHRNGPLTVKGGEFDGQLLSEVVQKHPEMLAGKDISRTLRLSVLDAGDDLSIQVHPYDQFANEHENDMGKTESWYIMEAADDTTLVAGTTISDPEVIKKAVEDGTIMNYVRKVKVQEGDYISIPCGTLHALGKGILTAEIGTNSDTTYRFYDYGRKDSQGNSRPLHIDKSFAVADFTSQPQVKHFSLEPKDATTIMQVERNDHYYVNLVDVVDEYDFTPNGLAFFIVTAVRGELTYECEGETCTLPYSESIFVPANSSKIVFHGNGRLMISYTNWKEK